MSKKFDNAFFQFQDIWEESYVTVSQFYAHQNPVTCHSIISAIGKFSEIHFLSEPNLPPQKVELACENWSEICLDSAAEHISGLFTESVRSCGLKFSQDAALELSLRFLSDFNNPRVFSNSPALNWNIWNRVTDQVRDMFVVAIDNTKIRFLLAICPD